MLYKQTIRAGEVREINKVGRQIKVINCEASLELRVFLKGKNLLTTEVRSGFDVSFLQFDSITIQSEQQQKIEIWASENPLGYEAPSKGSNQLQSLLIEHYGDDQVAFDFEAGRVAVSLYSEKNFFVGGQGCTVETGLPMSPNTIHKVEGAGALTISMDIPANQTLSGSFESLSTDSSGGHELRYPTVLNESFYGLKTAASHGLLAKFDGSWTLNVSNDVNYYALFMFDDGVAYYDDFYRLQFKSKSGAITQLAPTMPSFFSGNSVERWVCATGYIDSTSSNFKAVNVDSGDVVEHTHPASVNAIHYSKSLNKTFFVQGGNVVTTDGLPNEWGGIPALTEIYSGSIGGVPNSRITENDEYIVFSGDLSALIINKADMSVTADSNKNVVFASRDGRVKAFDENQFYISENGGATWGVAVQDTALNLVYANRKYSVIEKKGEFYILREFGTPTVFKFAAKKETSKPKALIRAMRQVI
ncbi:MAG: hypothetical protein CMK63_03885 [Pseudoalteromonadaceae bacterium]|jgi:hypothetical protein|nr:hypothetical protein [Pseudoalteromonadaceae bacterium]|tara:strand:- start:4271 stop:5695 length:1425 start_codon:yes stop_codon:yes gene_type:complete